MSKAGVTSVVCYFFFKDGQKQRTHGTDALRAILHQLFEKTDLITYALPSYNLLRHSFSKFWEILIKAARGFKAGQIICLLDALDECEADARDQLTAKLTELFSRDNSHKSHLCSLKFLITSRPYATVERIFQRLSNSSAYVHFDGDDKSKEIGEEINLVIDARPNEDSRPLEEHG